MAYGDKTVLRNAALEFAAPEFVAIAGPNGAGKSTLLGIMAGMRPGYAGSCQYAGKEVSLWSRRAFAREVCFIPQALRVEFPFTVEQVVLMGRTPHCDGLFETAEDWLAAEQAMATTETLDFRGREFRSLSGGERQLVVLASALAQQPKALLLDEPTAFLDIKHQVAIYRLMRELSRQGALVVAVTHDLNLAANFADRIVMLSRGAVVADAPPSGVLAPELIREIFGIESEIRPGFGGRPWILYGE